MENNTTQKGRVIGLDAHPDTFAIAIVRGLIPADAVVEKVSDKIPISQLESWALRHTTPEDLFVLEASGNSFHIVRVLQKIGRQAFVLESQRLGQLKDVHANNDRISAVRIAKAWLAGTARKVWLPDPITQERRDWFHAYKKAVKRTTQMNNRINSYLSDHGVRLDARLDFAGAGVEEQMRAARAWTPREWQVLAGHLMDLRHAREQSAYWQSLMSQEVLTDPTMLSLVRMCGVRDTIAFALLAIIGDIGRFENPKKLVSYFGLNPSFDDSGNEEWRGGVKGHGRKDIRSMLIQGAQALLSSKHPLGKWGRKLALAKNRNIAVVAVARRMAVAIWYLLKGKWTTLEEIDASLKLKISKILSNISQEGYQLLNTKRGELRNEVFERLKTGRTYFLDPNKKMPPRNTSQPAESPALQKA